MNILKKLWQAKSSSTQYLVKASLVLALSGLYSQQAYAEHSIATVQLLLGQDAQVERAGVQEPLYKGAEIYQGDIIETGEQTNLHLHFIDKAIAALRPNTRYEIECYDTDINNTCLKLNLLEGEVRQITGQAGQLNKNSFRLNTPIAAIGIRGTDFVTRTGDQQAFIKVLSGEIIGSPLGADCRADTLGPCASKFALSLKGSDGKILWIKANQAPQFIFENFEEMAVKDKITQIEQADSSKIYNLIDSPELIQTFLNLSSYVPEGFEPTEGYQYQEMVFGSWSGTSTGIAVPYDEASYNREVTVGSTEYGLWRTPLEAPIQGSASFRPEQANITFDAATYLEDVNLADSSRLYLDFDAATASVNLNFVTDGVPYLVQGSSNISRNDGIFTMKTNDEGRFYGAVTQDLSQAGTMLSQPYANGDIKAQILWAQ